MAMLLDDLPDNFSFAQLKHGRTHYQIDGPDEGIKLLLIHGATVPAWEFDLLVPYLNEAGFQTIRADLLGHGYSERPDTIYDIALFREQLISLLDHLSIFEPIHIFGHSLGAAIGGSLINHYPHRFNKLILAAPLVNFIANAPVLRVLKLPMLGKWLINWYMIPMLKRRRTKRYGPIAGGRFVAKFHSQFLLPGFEKALLSLFRDDVLDDQTECYQQLQKMGHTYLILRGTEDEIITAEQIAYLQTILPSAQMVQIEDAPHAFILTHPLHVATAVIKFLKQNRINNIQPTPSQTT